MNIELSITVESAWRGPVLDTVSPILSITLEADADRPGSLSAEKELRLADQQAVKVWCIYRNAEEFILHVYDSNLKTLMKIETKNEIYAEAVLPDGKQYQFNLREAKP